MQVCGQSKRGAWEFTNSVSCDISAIASLVGSGILLPGHSLFLLWVLNDEAPSCSSPEFELLHG